SRHFRARSDVSRSRTARVRRNDRDRSHAATQRLSVRLLHPRGVPWIARHRRADHARRDDDAGRSQRLSRQRAPTPALLCAVLAPVGHHSGLALHGRLSDGSPSMTDAPYDRAPGYSSRVVEAGEATASHAGIYTLGLALAVILTATSFWVANTSLIWPPGIPLGLAVLAIAQMGVHLVFFLHITTGPDNTNNVLALAFGVLIVFLVVAGSLWIMANLHANLMPGPELMDLRMQH